MNLYQGVSEYEYTTSVSVVSGGVCFTYVYPERSTDLHTGPTTRICDGAPRAIGARELITSLGPSPTGACFTSTVTSTGSYLIGVTLLSTPACTIATEGCDNIWSIYQSRSKEWSSWVQSNVTTTSIPSPLKPWPCPITTPLVVTVTVPPTATATATATSAASSSRSSGGSSSIACAQCVLSAPAVTLFYWPTAAEPKICNQSVSASPSLTSRPPIPSVAVIGNHTVTSPSVYLSFKSISAQNMVLPGGLCGTTLYNTGISLHPSAISTARVKLGPQGQIPHRGIIPHTNDVFPFDFADLNTRVVNNATIPLVPWTAYTAGENCPITTIREGDTYTFDRLNCTMIRNDYTPQIIMPTAITQIEPHWTSCATGNYGLTMIPLSAGSSVVQSPTPLIPMPTATPKPSAGAPTSLPTSSGSRTSA